MRVTFGDFTLDLDRRLLLRGAEDVHLPPKAFELLRVLLEHRPNVVAKEALMKALWPATFVADNNLPTLITDLRAALQDAAREPRFIRTVHGYGYAFAGIAVDERSGHTPAPRAHSEWRLIWQRDEMALFEGDNVLGRPADGVIGLDSPTVSRRHARIHIEGADASIEDLGSKNGTWIADTAVTGAVPLRDGDVLRLGSVVVTAHHVSSLTATATVDLEDTAPRESPRVPDSG